MSNKPALRDGDSICNAESVCLADVLNALDRARSSVLHLQSVAGLSENSAGRFERDRWEITQGKVYVLNLLEDEIRKLRTYLMGEKPDLLSVLEFERSRHRRMAIDCAHVSEKELELDPGAVDFTFNSWFRNHSVSEFLADFLRPFRPFPGNAEEQPGPREESPGPIGETSCDGPGGESDSFPPVGDSLTLEKWASDQSASHLHRVFEASRVELESRGAILHWSLTGF